MENKESEKERLEQEMVHTLTEGKMKTDDPEEQAIKRLPPKYEVRIPAVTDPIVEETELYRSMANEVDGRYDKYLERARKSDK